MSIKSFAVLPVTLAFACGGSLPAVVAGDEVPQGSHVNMSIPTSEDDALAQDLAKVLIEAESVPPDGQLRTTGSLRWKVTKEPSQELSLMGREQGYAPQFRVTAGWYLYLYLNSVEYNRLGSAVGGALGGAICSALGVTGVGGLACATVIGALAAYIAEKDTPGPNQCGELRLAWGAFIPVGYKVIDRPCNKI
ncbi:ubiquitin family protein [Actinotignum schaalii]|uniref:hypothetical protein n=1 Tax=Actinotignum schaalii TaxID=59505 RepID=UPI0011DD0876|nr:hypothetical protein [Actinotignum schaalii]WQN44398.1 hypothetical protein U4A90_05170 [Actinotignum schaalii]